MQVTRYSARPDPATPPSARPDPATPPKRPAVTAIAVAALAAVLLTGCRDGGRRTAGIDRDAGTGTSSTTGSTAPTAGTQNPPTTPAQVDSDINTVDGLLGQLEGQLNKADQAPADGDG
jgi:hypothetical protein